MSITTTTRVLAALCAGSLSTACILEASGGVRVSGTVTAQESGRALDGIRVTCMAWGEPADGGQADAGDAGPDHFSTEVVVTTGVAGKCGAATCPPGHYTCQDSWLGPSPQAMNVGVRVEDPDGGFAPQSRTVQATRPPRSPWPAQPTAVADFALVARPAADQDGGVPQ